ncbi:MAG TPA: polymer-forming cytoskeletal protein [Lysobacter sp.]
MAIFNSPQPSTPKRENAPGQPATPESALSREPDRNEIAFGAASTPKPAPAPTPAPRPAEREGKESVIAADLSIEGKIQGAGHIRIAGRFKGDVTVEGDLTVEVGAKVNGSVRARKVVIAGELEGNVESAQRVELLEGGTVVGDVKAGVVSIAPGSRMRGQVEFGFEDKDARNGKSDKAEKHEAKTEAATAS